MKPELPKETHPDSEFNVRPHTPKIRKNPDHLAMEWPISRWIKVYEALQVATYATNPADIELGETALVSEGFRTIKIIIKLAIIFFILIRRGVLL